MIDKGSPLSFQALNKDKIKDAFAKVGKDINEKKLLSLGVLTPSNHKLVPSIGGLILFGKEEIREQFVPDARVRCARFHGNDKMDIIVRFEIDGTILDAIEQVPKFIRRNTQLHAQIQKIRRKGIPEYPQIAIREILINALAHADYSLSGSNIQIAIFANRLIIQNPGMFPFGFTMQDLKSGVSRVRNRVIAKVFHELKLMEEWGSGYKRVIETCSKNGYPMPTWTELGTTMQVTFYPYEGISSQSQVRYEISDREKLILSLFEGINSLSFREIYNHLSLKLSERMLRYELAKMKSKGFLKTTGKARSTLWLKVDKNTSS